MPDAQTFKVLDAVQQLPQPCTRIQVQQTTGLSERVVIRRLKQLQLGGYVALARGIGWNATDRDLARPEAVAVRDYAFRSVLVPGAPWPYARAQGAQL